VKKLETLDKNKDGYFDKDELVRVVEKLLEEEEANQFFRRAVCLAVGLTCLLKWHANILAFYSN
jgi:hypothetical protein